MPCSPLITPPASTQTRRISSPAASTRSSSPGFRRSKQMFGCRLPSPAWKTFESRSPWRSQISQTRSRISGSFAARDDGVVDVEVGREPAHRAERALPRPPEARALGVVARDLARAWLPAAGRERAHARDLAARRPRRRRRARRAAPRRRRAGARPRRRSPRPRGSCAGPRSRAPRARARARMIAVTARHEDTTSGKIARSVSTASGIGTSRTQTRVTTPSVPSLPTTAPTRSRSGANARRPAEHERPRRPAARARRPSTWFVVVPYLSVCGPPEFSATLPPIVQAAWLDGIGRVEEPVAARRRARARR